MSPATDASPNTIDDRRLTATADPRETRDSCDTARSSIAGAFGSARQLGKADALEQMSSLEWTRERDVLATLCSEFARNTFFLGFAAQTAEDEGEKSVESQLLAYGAEKLQRKGCHAIFINRVGVPGSGFGSPTNAGWLLRSGKSEVSHSGASQAKSKLAAWMLDQLSNDLSSGPAT